MIGLIGMAVIAYAATNIDDLLLLCGFFGHPAYATKQIVLGQFIGIGILVSVSLLCALAAVAVPLPYIGLLGFAPIYLGCCRFRRRFDVVQRKPSSSRQILAVIAATVADGGDNIVTYVPIFTGSRGMEGLAVVAVFAVLTGLWCWMAMALVKHPVVGRMFRAWSTRLLPFLLIAVGLFALWRNGSFGLI